MAEKPCPNIPAVEAPPSSPVEFTGNSKGSVHPIPISRFAVILRMSGQPPHVTVGIWFPADVGARSSSVTGIGCAFAWRDAASKHCRMKNAAAIA